MKFRIYWNLLINQNRTESVSFTVVRVAQETISSGMSMPTIYCLKSILIIKIYSQVGDLSRCDYLIMKPSDPWGRKFSKSLWNFMTNLN